MLESLRLVLRVPVAGDLDWFVTHMNTPAVLRHLGGVRERADYAVGFDQSIRGFAETGFGFWTVVLRDGATPIGKCGLGVIGSSAAPDALRGQTEIGWSLAEAFWGRGLALEAAQAVLRHAFVELGFATIFSQTSESNRASTRLMERLGLERMPALDYVDPDYPAADNPTTVYRAMRP